MSAKKYGAEEPRKCLSAGDSLGPAEPRSRRGASRGCPEPCGASGAPRGGRKAPGNHSSERDRTATGREGGREALPGAGGDGRVPAASPRDAAGISAPRCVRKVALRSSLPAAATLKHSPGACWASVMARPGGLVWLDVGTFVMADL